MVTLRISGCEYTTSAEFDAWWDVFGPCTLEPGPMRAMHFAAWRAWIAARTDPEVLLEEGATLGFTFVDDIFPDDPEITH